MQLDLALNKTCHAEIRIYLQYLLLQFAFALVGKGNTKLKNRNFVSVQYIGIFLRYWRSISLFGNKF